MSEESLDYLKLCPNYYTNWEDGCCMENCTFNDLDECPIHYVKGLLEEKDNAIENWETMYKSVMQTCHNDKEEIERLNKQLAESESRFQAHKQNDARIIQDQTDLIENLKQQLAESEEFLVATKWNVQDLNKQLADTETQNKRVLEKLELIVSANQELEQKLAEKDKEISNLKNIVNGIDTLKQYDKDAKQIILINPDNVYADGHRLVVKNADQDKISFCIEKLEKVKELVEEKGAISSPFGNLKIQASDVSEIIDSQIKQLKEGK